MSFYNLLEDHFRVNYEDQGVEIDFRETKTTQKITMVDFEGNFDHYSIPMKKWEKKVAEYEKKVKGLNVRDDEFDEIMEEFCLWFYDFDE